MAAPSDVIDTHISPKLYVAASTKDSVHVKWRLDVEDDVSTDFPSPWQHMIDGYDVSYQADESHVVQYSHKLSTRRTEYHIKQLHEDTAYRVCLRVYTRSELRASRPCINASTKNGSLHVALGSTFGAFLALGIIVGFVLLAKWQHARQRRSRKRKQQESEDGEAKNSLMGCEGRAGAWRESDVPMSELSLKVNESQGRVRIDELGSQFELNMEGSVIPEQNSDVTPEPIDGSDQYLPIPLSPYPSISPIPSAAASDDACYSRDADATSTRSKQSRFSRERSVDSGRSVGRLSRQPSQGSCSCASPLLTVSARSLAKQRSVDHDALNAHDKRNRFRQQTMSYDCHLLDPTTSNNHLLKPLQRRSPASSRDSRDFPASSAAASCECFECVVSRGDVTFGGSTGSGSLRMSPKLDLFCVKKVPPKSKSPSPKPSEDNISSDAHATSRPEITSKTNSMTTKSCESERQENNQQMTSETNVNTSRDDFGSISRDNCIDSSPTTGRDANSALAAQHHDVTDASRVASSDVDAML